MSTAPARPPLLPPVYFVGSLAAMFFFDRVVPGATLVRTPATLSGVLPVVVGFALVVATVDTLRRHGTAVRPSKPPTVLVTAGTFRVSRNPIYLGMIMMLSGAAVLLGSATPFCIVAAFAWWMHTRFVRFEEAVLFGRFGGEYRRYQADVRRWM